MPYSPAQIAHVCHEANRALQTIHGNPAIPASPDWTGLGPADRQTAIDGVLAALDGQSPEELHESWMAAKFEAGWVYGDVKDPAAKTHPCLVDYEELPRADRDKDELFAAVVEALRGDDATVPDRDLSDRHPGVQDLMRWLTPNPGLPPMAAHIAKLHHMLADAALQIAPDSPELTAGLRKVLEAKDCLVRAVIDAYDDSHPAPALSPERVEEARRRADNVAAAVETGAAPIEVHADIEALRATLRGAGE